MNKETVNRLIDKLEGDQTRETEVRMVQNKIPCFSCKGSGHIVDLVAVGTLGFRTCDHCFGSGTVRVLTAELIYGGRRFGLKGRLEALLDGETEVEAIDVGNGKFPTVPTLKDDRTLEEGRTLATEALSTGRRFGLKGGLDALLGWTNELVLLDAETLEPVDPSATEDVE